MTDCLERIQETPRCFPSPTERELARRCSDAIYKAAIIPVKPPNSPTSYQQGMAMSHEHPGSKYCVHFSAKSS